MKKSYYDVLKDKFSHGSGDAKRVFNKYIPDDSIADLNNPRGAGATWFHEHGHMIDDLAGDVSNDKLHIDALYKDFLDSILDKTYNEIESELIDMRIQSVMSDLFNGLSKNRINGVATHPLRQDGSSY